MFVTLICNEFSSAKFRFFLDVASAKDEFTCGTKKIAHQNIKSSLYSRYYAEACNEWRGPSPRLGTGATQLPRNDTVSDLTDPATEPQISRTSGDVTTVPTKKRHHFRYKRINAVTNHFDTSPKTTIYIINDN